ncbi:MAG: pilus assembly protein [Caulobacter sp.]|nr:pilus assembly protein [Caulobacter sp.]
MTGFLRRLGRDRRGVSAVEFALIAPVMIAFYFGMAEITQALLAERRAGHAASAIGDLVAQSSTISNSDIGDIFMIAQTIMKPYPTTSLQMRITSITANSSGTPKVDWSNASGLSPLTTGATVAGVPAGVVSAGQSVIMSEVNYSYDSPVDFMVPNAVKFTRKFYLRPRKSDSVVKVN